MAEVFGPTHPTQGNAAFLVDTVSSVVATASRVQTVDRIA